MERFVVEPLNDEYTLVNGNVLVEKSSGTVVGFCGPLASRVLHQLFDPEVEDNGV
jgi:hypothetical protein